MVSIVICGNRSFNNYDYLKECMDEIVKDIDDDIEIVSGRADGADTLGEKYAMEKGYGLVFYPARWEKYGKKAGPIRNKQMVDYAKDHNGMVVAFWDGKGSGTRSTINFAKRSNVPLKVFSF